MDNYSRLRKALSEAFGKLGIEVREEDIPLVDLHECFINGREVAPRYVEVPQA